MGFGKELGDASRCSGQKLTANSQSEMRIVYHHRTTSRDAQGIHIVSMLAAFRELGHKVELVSLVSIARRLTDASPRRDAEDGFVRGILRRIPFAYDAIQLAYNLVGLPLLSWKLLKWPADFIYERYSLLNFTGRVVAHVFGIPLVLEVNSPFALEQQRNRDIRAFRFAAWMERVILNGAAAVIVVSTPLRRMMISAGVEEKKLVVMHNGVEAWAFGSDTKQGALRCSLGLENKTVIGFVGWFQKWHGVELLLQTFHRGNLAQRGGVVLLVGDGPAMADLRTYARANGLLGDVIFTGPVPHSDIPFYLGIIDIAVQPAANEYCCPMKILEYMAAGKPIVAPRQENIEEILKDGQNARLFTPGDEASLSAALTAMIDDPASALAMAARARNMIVECGYQWVNNAIRVIKLVESSSSERQLK